jgi:galactose mutarotase-like enzyme
MAVLNTRNTVGEFAIHTLANEAISLSIAPELGGRIVSLRDRISRREWLDGWTPVSKRRIWQPTDPANFETGPGAGIDECLPTVLACKVGRKLLPDHGELWNQVPDFDVDPKGGFSCRWDLKCLPLGFERRISLGKNEVRFDYRIENRADAPTPFLWAWHPLFTWKRGDQIRTSEKTCLSPGGRDLLPWPHAQPGNDLSRAFFQQGATPAAKVFLGPLSKGRAEIHASNGARLALTWPTAFIPYAGIWITRGFWKGLHHWAIEPTNAPVDCLSDLHRASPDSLLAPREVREWSLRVKLSPKHP